MVQTFLKFGIGQPLKRKEDSKFLTGNGSYTDDLNFKDQVYMHILRSPFASAKIKKVDFSDAAKKDGVITILSNEIITKLIIIDINKFSESISLLLEILNKILLNFNFISSSIVDENQNFWYSDVANQ